MSIEVRLGTVVVVLPSATRAPTNFKLKSPNASGGGSWHWHSGPDGRVFKFNLKLEHRLKNDSSLTRGSHDSDPAGGAAAPPASNSGNSEARRVFTQNFNFVTNLK